MAWNPALMPNTATQGDAAPHVQPIDANRDRSSEPTSPIEQASPDSVSVVTGGETIPDQNQQPVEQLVDKQQLANSSTPPSNAPKHASTVSFTRTVSQDVNWLDEEDGDWDIGCSDSSPFDKFMPESNRTNSFPLIPPQPEAIQALPVHTEKPLSHSQVEDIMMHEEIQESFTKSTSLDSDVALQESRFEEGVPLIAQSQPPSTLVESFVDDGANDDFFGEIQKNTQNDSMAQAPERKSTMQAIGSALDSSGIKDFNAGLEGQNQNTGDLAAKWAMEFADDEDFVLDEGIEKPLDPASFFGDDDAGLLEDEASNQAALSQQETISYALPKPNTQLAPATVPHPLPSPSWHPQVSLPLGQATVPDQSSVLRSYTPQPTPLQVPKAESFVAKSKGGYHSPYDLPMDVVKPKKRPSNQASPRTTISPTAAPLPKGLGSVQMGHPPRQDSSSSTSSFGAQPLHKASLKAKESFFEELPTLPKARPSSRQSLPSPSQATPFAPPQRSPQGPPPTSAYNSSPPTISQRDSSAPSISNLVSPPHSGPYAPVQSNALSGASPVVSTKYSPAPPHGQPTSNVVPPPLNRYSPAPAGSGSHRGAGIHSGTVLPHQPRTSSPLAHFETGSNSKPRVSSAPPNGEAGPILRSNSSGYPHPATRVPSLPPTREVEEEPDIAPTHTEHQNTSLSTLSSPTDNRNQAFSQPAQLSPQLSTSQPLSPPKRGQYTPQAFPHQSVEFVPPPRSQTQSPGALYGNKSPARVEDLIPRPSSVHESSSQRSSQAYAPMQSTSSAVSLSRPRGLSQKFELIPPTDGREQDPLQRWKGCPVFTWGVGGTIITSFPKPMPRYGGMASSRPTMVMSPGEVKVSSVKEVNPLEDRLAKFPGPLKGKSKKKETIAWLTTSIEELEKEMQSIAYQSHQLRDEKRPTERILLWKILRVLVEHDGVLEGNPAVEKAVKDVFMSGSEADTAKSSLPHDGSHMMSLQESAMTRMQSDAVDSTTVEKIRSCLLNGDRETAVWIAVDKRLWGHAILIASTMPRELFMKVTQEFVRKEVNYPSHNNEPLAALYGIFSGNFEECVDELVPVHARAGLQLMSTNSNYGPTKDAIAGLDKWKETLSLVLSNRSQGDTVALTSLGNLLAGYGRAEAAHICFLFAKNTAVFGGLNASSNFVLLGVDHRTHAHQFANEVEAFLLSEVYEYGLSLAGVVNGAPHLAAFKLQHALTLAEYGFRDKALQYCEILMASISSQTRKSPYHHAALENAVDDLTKRLKQTPKEESNSWIPKPSMTKMSDSLFKKFNNFVAGEDQDDLSTRSPPDGAESGPFARVAGGTPTISRSPSTTNFDSPGNSMTQTYQPIAIPTSQFPLAPATRSASRYAPAPGSATSGPSSIHQSGSNFVPLPKPSLERKSSDLSRGAYESNYNVSSDTVSSPPYNYALNSDAAQSYDNPFSSPTKTNITSSPHQPTPIQAASRVPSPYQSMSSPVISTKATGSPTEQPLAFGEYQSPSCRYEPPLTADLPSEATAEPSAEDAVTAKPSNDIGTGSVGGYEPPSYGYEPPTYQPYQPDGSEEEDEGKLKPRKKTIFDEDDDIPALRAPSPGEKSKAEKDKENEEMFRKAAEEDSKRADAEKAQQKSGGFLSRFLPFVGNAKKEEVPVVHKAKMGDRMQFVWDPDLNRWVNKAAGAEQTEAKTATPPPPKGGLSRSVSGTPPPPANGRVSAPPPRSFTPTPSTLGKSPSKDNLAAPVLMMRSVSNASTASLPPRPSTALSNASSIDDLLGAPMARKGPKKPRKSGRYVDVMAKP